MSSKGKGNKGMTVLQGGKPKTSGLKTLEQPQKPARTPAEQAEIDKSEKRQKRAQELKDAFKTIASTKAGQIVLEHLVISVGVFRVASQVSNEGYDVHATTYNLGRQSVYMASIRPFLREHPELLNRIERPELEV